MTKEEITALFERMQAWPLRRQEEVALYALALERLGADVYILSDEERADLEEGIAEAERGEFATDEEMAALFNRYR